ncbi:DUF1682 domain-containing protein [Luteibacter aegosomaticola]|uniref:DUF1682 domain-containing protein n=1 Tax=Luteibacter aegosomaticola TaxID=2911538 RepID=UPI001FFAA611|nr:DUF1682 domain-containing protein [Luteibacter aegosomaticola]UPG89316.1 DUF1682 domain-containing protein [Luteibacter aegosomaticola]
MGEAKRRGPREQRVASAIEAIAQERAEAIRRAEEAETLRQQRIAERWAKLSPEEKQRRIAIAQGEAALLGHLVSIPGSGVLAAAGALGVFFRKGDR